MCICTCQGLPRKPAGKKFLPYIKYKIIDSLQIVERQNKDPRGCYKQPYCQSKSYKGIE